MNEKALYYVEMLLKAAEVVNRRSSGTCALIEPVCCRPTLLMLVKPAADAQLARRLCKMTYRPSKLGHTDLLLGL